MGTEQSGSTPSAPPTRHGGLAGFIVRRILLGLLVLALVSMVVFAATQALPGDPARSILGRTATPASLKALRDQLHLNQPVLQQYWNWITGFIHGDMGTSLAAQEPVSTYLHDRLINSAFLVIVADNDQCVELGPAHGAFEMIHPGLCLRVTGGKPLGGQLGGDVRLGLAQQFLVGRRVSLLVEKFAKRVAIDEPRPVIGRGHEHGRM